MKRACHKWPIQKLRWNLIVAITKAENRTDRWANRISQFLAIGVGETAQCLARKSWGNCSWSTTPRRLQQINAQNNPHFEVRTLLKSHVGSFFDAIWEDLSSSCNPINSVNFCLIRTGADRLSATWLRPTAFSNCWLSARSDLVGVRL